MIIIHLSYFKQKYAIILLILKKQKRHLCIENILHFLFCLIKLRLLFSLRSLKSKHAERLIEKMGGRLESGKKLPLPKEASNWNKNEETKRGKRMTKIEAWLSVVFFVTNAFILKQYLFELVVNAWLTSFLNSFIKTRAGALV